MPMKSSGGSICIIAAFVGGLAQAQFPSSNFQFPPPPPDPKELRIAMDVQNVLLDVSVKDKNGQWISGLTKDHFRIVENGEPQEITWFTGEDIPVTLGIVLDNSGSMRAKRAEAVTAALAFVKTSNPHDEMFVITFNDRVHVGLPKDIPFSDSASKLRDALMVHEPAGRTALYDGIAKALEHGNTGKHARKALLVISDGGDNASGVNRETMQKLAMESRATIYTIGVFNDDDKEKNPGVLRELARITGGEAFVPGNLKQLEGICEKIGRDIRNRYVLSYTPIHKKPVGRERKIKVAAHTPERGHLSVRSRTRYLAPELENISSGAADRTRKRATK